LYYPNRFSGFPQMVGRRLFLLEGVFGEILGLETGLISKELK
jgi:hypothetical protein